MMIKIIKECEEKKNQLQEEYTKNMKSGKAGSRRKSIVLL